MSPAELTALVTSLESILLIVENIGLPGLLTIFMIGPVFVLCLIMYMHHLSIKRSDKLLEVYRADTHEILQSIGTKHDNLCRMHENAINQIKTTEQHNAIMHTLVVNNTQAMEQLKAIIQTIVKENR